MIAELEDGRSVRVIAEKRNDSEFVDRTVNLIFKEFGNEAIKTPNKIFYVIEITDFILFDDSQKIRIITFNQKGDVSEIEEAGSKLTLK